MTGVRPLRLAGFVVLLATAVAAAVAIALVSTPGLSTSSGIAPSELRLHFAVTPTAIPFLALIALVVPAVAAWGLARGGAADGMRLAPFVIAMIGVLLAQSVTAFFVSWEAMSLVSAFLVGTHHERREVRRALLSYLLVSQLGALCIVAALALLGAHAGGFDFAVIAHSAPSLPNGLRTAVIALAFVGFGSKAGLVPLHFWLPLAHPVAPANASALLSGVMLKVAVYGLLLTFGTLAAPLPLAWTTIVLVVGLITAVTGALYAAVDSDFKRLLAYSSIENLGIIVGTLGVALTAAALGRPAIAQLAMVALLVHAVGHGLFKSLLFLGAGNVLAATHTTNLEHLGGLRTSLPLTAAFVAFGCAAAAALPPLVGFASEWLIFRSFVALLPAAPPIAAAVILIGIALLAVTSGLAALAFVKLFGIAFLGEPREDREVDTERADASTAALAWLAALATAFGIVPQAVVNALAPAATALSGISGAEIGVLPALPALVVLCPIVGGIGALLLARGYGVRRVPTWSCGSVVTPRSQYTATAFSKPIRRIFGFVLFPDHVEIRDSGTSRWFPVRIRYDVTTRYVIDEVARDLAALAQRIARRARIVQAGLLRVYLIYAVVAVLVLLVVAR